MDEADYGHEAEQFYLKLALENRADSGPVPTGNCHNCDEPVALDQTFCDVDCRADWAKRQRSAR